ncbi:hypothetical protein V2G26_000455 [Clonostachys chloroleuca]
MQRGIAVAVTRAVSVYIADRRPRRHATPRALVAVVPARTVVVDPALNGATETVGSACLARGTVKRGLAAPCGGDTDAKLRVTYLPVRTVAILSASDRSSSLAHARSRVA